MLPQVRRSIQSPSSEEAREERTFPPERTVAMRARAGMPCHHPKWPMRCPKCRKNALGFNITVPIGRRWDPDSGEQRIWAWSTSGMVCMECNRALVPVPEKDAPVSEEYLRALIRGDLPGIIGVTFLSESLFRITCRLPAEEAKQDPSSLEAING